MRRRCAQRLRRRRRISFGFWRKRHRLKEDKTALQAETETFGGAMKPLYVYFGDGKVLCGAENARLTVGGETFRVLYAEEKSGICGALYVRAVLEKEEKDDGNGA